MKNIIWLSSYPKSGNTWLRTFLTYLIKKEEDDILNNLVAPIVSARDRIEEYLFLETTELTNDEIEKYTPEVLTAFAKDIPFSPYFMKVHDAYTYTVMDEPLFPSNISIGAIYIIRNPLDVVPSYAHHNNDSIDNTIKVINNENFALCANTNIIRTNVRQKLLNWSGNVLSWTKQNNMPVLVIRYEDMVNSSLDTFTKVVSFSNIEATDQDILTACDKASFNKLKEKEQKFGYQGKAVNTVTFFRKGKIGSWRESLTNDQALQIIDAHRDVMNEFGYLNADGSPVF